VRLMLDQIEDPSAGREEAKKAQAAEVKQNSVPEMELLPYEHYDYVLVLARTTFDFNLLCDRLRLEKRQATNDIRYRGKIGLARAVPADRLLAILKEGEDAGVENRRLRKAYKKLTGQEWQHETPTTPEAPLPHPKPEAPPPAGKP
jgi:hypothetical protein